MDAYENLKKQLAPTNLYRLDGGTTVDFELKTYAEELQPAYDELEELIAERFLETASGYGLVLAEQASRLPHSGDLPGRRNALLALGSLTPNSTTKSDLEKALSAYGITATVEEKPAEKKVTVHFLKEPACGRSQAQFFLETFCPAHLSAEPDFSAIT